MDTRIKELVDLYIQKWNLEALIASLNTFLFMLMAFITINGILAVVINVSIIFSVIAMPLVILAFILVRSSYVKLDTVKIKITKLGGKIE